jgi:hypothetical protein
VSEGAVFGRLVNGEGELIAEGPCYVDEAAGQATLEPERAPGVVQKERGTLALQLDSGRSFKVAGQPLIIDYRAPGGANEDARRRIFRLRVSPYGPPEAASNGRAPGGATNQAQEAKAAGAAGEGAPAAPSAWGRPPATGETPAAR